jgi:hypothetical protein
MNILGHDAYHGDSAACLFVDGKFVAAAETERFRRIKRGGISNSGRANDKCGQSSRRQSQLVIAAKAARAMKANSGWELVGLRISSAVLWLASYPEGTADARTGALMARHSYMARVGGVAQETKSTRDVFLDLCQRT